MISPDRSTHFYKIKGAQSAYFHKDITIRVQLVINIKDCTPNICHSQNLHGLWASVVFTFLINNFGTKPDTFSISLFYLKMWFLKTSNHVLL